MSEPAAPAAVSNFSPSAPTDRFDELFQRLYAGLVGLTRRVVGDRLDAEEVVQEAFVRLDGQAVLDRPDEEVAAWLRRVCLNLGFNRLRERRHARERLERVGRLELTGRDGDPTRPGPSSGPRSRRPSAPRWRRCRSVSATA